MTATNTMRIYVACLAAYNAGTLHGRWIDLDGKSGDDIRDEVDAMLAASPAPDAEEWAIHDHEGFGPYKLSESESFDDIAELVEAVEEHGDAVLAYMANNCGDLSDFADAYLGEFPSVKDYAYDYIDQTGMLDNVNETISRYFDYDSFAHDMEVGGDIWTAPAPGGVYIFQNC